MPATSSRSLRDHVQRSGRGYAPLIRCPRPSRHWSTRTTCRAASRPSTLAEGTR
jgi:hypothetical protein